jgi:ribonuclease P protein component
MIGRLLHKADFERLLAVKPCSGSAHFALHHVPAGPGPAPAADAVVDQLSTENSPFRVESVDDCHPQHWLGCVIPKRHARRAVTRNLLRRQIRGAVQRHARQLPPGQWLVRLRRPFDRTEFVSAHSPRLRAATRGELDTLLRRARAPRVG